MDPITLPGTLTAGFLLAEANGERSRALFSVPANTDSMKAGTIVAADGTPATTPDESAGVLYASIAEETVAQKATVIARDAEVHGELLVFPAAANAATRAEFVEALATLGIVTRWTQRPAALAYDAVLRDDPEPEGGA